MQSHISRRKCLARAAAAGAGLGSSVFSGTQLTAATARTFPESTARQLQHWRGFNLLEKFNGRNDRFKETDFEWIAELGCNFVRLPMDYRMWIEDNDWTKFREQTLREIDEAVKFGCGISVAVSASSTAAGPTRSMMIGAATNWIA